MRAKSLFPALFHAKPRRSAESRRIISRQGAKERQGAKGSSASLFFFASPREILSPQRRKEFLLRVVVFLRVAACNMPDQEVAKSPFFWRFCTAYIIISLPIFVLESQPL